ncbi:MAG: peptidylprolyl isomerase [Calditrichaeota bacterium]|nr:peptidylprolyl isomerase [Calditrichota bacterium]
MIMIRKSLLLIVLLLGSLHAVSGQEEVLDKIVAIVDDTIILYSELQQFAYSLAIQGGVDPVKEPEEFDKILQKTLAELITQKVLLVQARLDSLEVSDRQIESVLEQQIEQMVQQLGSETRVEEYFGTTLRQIRREFREEVEERLLVQRLQEVKSMQTRISRREVEHFYTAHHDSLPVMKEAVKISHILVNVEPSEAALEAARKLAEDVLEQLHKGADFAELARQHSQDPGSTAKGGDLGRLQRGDLVKEFEEVAFQLEPGEISEIVRTKFGLHIIQMVAKIGEKIHTRHILFRLDTSPEDEQRTVDNLYEIRRQILAGETTWNESVEKDSQDSASKGNKGDLGWFEMEQFQIPAFKTAITGLEAGQLSDPVKTKFGIHLVRVDDRRDERALDIVKDWEQIEKWALELKRRKEFEKYVAEIRKDVYIEIKDI